jgi:hypothetical protein
MYDDCLIETPYRTTSLHVGRIHYFRMRNQRADLLCDAPLICRIRASDQVPASLSSTGIASRGRGWPELAIPALLSAGPIHRTIRRPSLQLKILESIRHR